MDGTRRSPHGPAHATRRLRLALALALGLAAPQLARATPGPDGDWKELFLPVKLSLHGSVYDPVGDRFIVACGNGEDGAYHNEVWAMPLAGAPGWAEIVPTGPLPGTRVGHSTIYDPVRRRLIVFGGLVAPGPGALLPPYTYSNDVWALSLDGAPIWTQLAPTGTPPPGREYSAAVYDPVRDRMIVYGGIGSGSSGELADAWALSLAGTPAWSALPTAPITQSGHAAIYDPVRDRMVVFSPVSGLGVGDEVWALRFTPTPAWSRIATATGAPSRRYGSTAVYDTPGDRMVVFGGSDNNIPSAEVWSYSFAAPVGWSNITPAGASPGPRAYLSSAFDSARRGMVTTGGDYGTREVWSLSLAPGGGWAKAWTDNVQRPSYRRGHTAVYDPSGRRMVVVGGENISDPSDAVWGMALDGAPAWTRLATTGFPGQNIGPLGVYDAARHRVLLHGGSLGPGTPTWALSLDPPMAWSAIQPLNPLPHNWSQHVGIYDPARDRLLVFGASETHCTYETCNTTYFPEVWALNLSGTPTWTQLATAGPVPPVLYGADAVYDPLRDRMLVFGGLPEGNLGAVSGRTWALTLSGTPTWSVLAESPSPLLPRYFHSAIYDGLRDQMLVYGGWGNGSNTDDVWALGLGGLPAWVQLHPGGFKPETRADHSAIYDPVTDRMVAFAGYYNRSTWTLDWGGGPTAVEISADEPQASPTRVALRWLIADAGSARPTLYRNEGDGEWRALSTLEPAGDGSVAYEDGDVVPGARYGYRLSISEGGREVIGGEVWVTVPRPASLSLAGATPNPASGPFEIAFSLPTAEPARIELLDLQGRRLAAREVGSLGPGEHRLSIGDSRFAPGILVVRLTQGGASLTRRVALVR